MALICQCGCNREIPPSWTHYRKAPKYLRGHNTKTSGHTARVAQQNARRLTELPVLTCQCGCGEIIPPLPSHRYRPPKYIQAHYLKMGTHQRIQFMRESQAKRRSLPPEGWAPPDGFCECGCGKMTKIAKVSRPERNQYAGYPLRFANGHNTRLRTGAEHPTWNGGKHYRDGYIEVHCPGHPMANRDGYVFEHRLVYEQSRGVTLPRGIHVHHVNGIRDDNRPENLIAATRAKHKEMHQLAGAIIGLLFDDRLLEAARQHIKQQGNLPDLAQLTQELYKS